MSHSLQNKQDKLTAGTGISITDNTIDCTVKAPTDYTKKDVQQWGIGMFMLGHSNSVSVANKGTKTYKNMTLAGSSITPEQSYSNGTDNHKTQSISAPSGTWRWVGGVNSLGPGDDGAANCSVYGMWQRIS